MTPTLPTALHSPTHRRRLCLCLLAALGPCLLPPHGAAALAWDALVVDRVAELGASSIEAAFPFKNSGKTPVTITSVQTSCGCTSTVLAKNDYAPGEGGELTVTYHFAGQVGPQKKIIIVTTSDAPDRPTILALRVSIPEFCSVSPRLLWWSVGEAAEAKQAAIAVNPALKAVVAQILSEDPVINAALATRPGEHDYVLSVAPVSTKAALRSSVRLRIAAAGFDPQIVTVYVLVR